MNGITRARPRANLQVIDGGLDPNAPGGEGTNAPENQQYQAMNLAVEAYGNELAILLYMEEQAANAHSPAPLFNIFQSRKDGALAAQRYNEMLRELSRQRHRMDESLRQLSQSVMTNLLMWTDAESVLERLFQIVVGKSDLALGPGDYSTILEKTLKMMAEKLMEQREITAMSKELAGQVGKTLGFEESGEAGVQGKIQEIILNTMMRNLALDTGEGAVYNPSSIRRLLTPKTEVSESSRDSRRARFADTEAMIVKLVGMIRG